jgi:threonyl-tRNA synthetase
LIEHYKGELPLWLSPTQVLLIPINPVGDRLPQAAVGHLQRSVSNGVKESVALYAQGIKEELEKNQIRVDIDMRNETLDKRIRNAELNKIPYCLVLGDREAKQGQVSVRKKGSGNQGAVALDKFIGEIVNRVQQYK